MSTTWWDRHWGCRRRIRFLNASGSVLTSPYIEVNIDPSTFNYDNANSDGSDLRFVDSDNSTELQYRVPSWVRNGTSTLGFIVPQITKDNFDHVFLYYNSPNKALSIKTITATTHARYSFDDVPVLHGTCPDLSGNSHDGTYEDNSNTPTAPSSVAGVISNAVRFRYAHGAGAITYGGQYVVVPHHNIFNTIGLAVQFYLKHRTSAIHSNISIINKTGVGTSLNLWKIETTYISVGTYGLQARWFGPTYPPYHGYTVTYAGPLTDEVFYKVRVEFDVSQGRMYVDDVLVASGSQFPPAESLTIPNDLYVAGADPTYSIPSNDCDIDELTFSSLLPSATAMSYQIGPEEKGWATRV